MNDPELQLMRPSPEQDEETTNARNAFRRKYKTENPNLYLEKEGRTVFEKILQTPNSSSDIEWCIKNGADLYKVRTIQHEIQLFSN
jgi:hypothetical protein